jgi:hypothetical protein
MLVRSYFQTRQWYRNKVQSNNDPCKHVVLEECRVLGCCAVWVLKELRASVLRKSAREEELYRYAGYDLAMIILYPPRVPHSLSSRGLLLN